MSTSEISSIDHTVLLCTRMQETRAFYADVMAFAVEDDRESWVSFRVGATLLTLRPRGHGLAWEDGPSTAGAVGIQLAFRVPTAAAVDACHGELVAAGVTILRPPTDLPAFSHRTLFLRDPEDNVLEIYADL